MRRMRRTRRRTSRLPAVQITIESPVNVPPAVAWKRWTTPEDIKVWNSPSPDWGCPAATIDLREGGAFSYRMEANDGSFGFDFDGTFTKIVEPELIEFKLGDGRAVRVDFAATSTGSLVRETFDAEDEHSAEQQRQGWQAILDNFARHAEQAEATSAPAAD